MGSFQFGDFDPSKEQSRGSLSIKLPVLYTVYIRRCIYMWGNELGDLSVGQYLPELLSPDGI